MAHEGPQEEALPEALHVTEWPELQEPLLIGAFVGWNDAAGSATWATRFLIDRWNAKRFAEIDPEEFFSFTDTRPQVKLTNGVVREVTWPSNEFYYAQRPAPPEEGTRPRRRLEPSRDVILLLGTEPNLRWRAFTSLLMSMSRRLGVAQVALLGGLLADVPHTRPVPITASATSPSMASQLAMLGLGRSKYQGPTGILGVLHDCYRRENIPALSLWGAAPHYLTVSPNLQVSEALLKRLNEILNLRLNLRELRSGAERFQERISMIVSQDPEATNYVHQLEERLAADPDEEPAMHEPEVPSLGETPPRTSGELPNADVVIKGIEELLRQNRRGADSDEDDEDTGEE